MAKQPVGNKSNRKFKSQKVQNLRTIRKQAVKKNKKQGISPSVQDARQKISQKKRKTVLDARDILAKKAKTQDARNKINKIRDVRTGRPNTGSRIKIIGNIVQKTDPNGKISLVTNKAKKVDMNLAIRKQLGLVPINRTSTRKVPPKRNAAVNTARSPPVNIRKTILNEMDYPPAVEPIRLYDPALYKWSKPELKVSAASQMINSLETTRQAMREALREEFSNGWPTYASHSSFQKMAGIYHKAPLRSSQSVVRPSRLQPLPAYVDLAPMEEDEDMPMAAPARSTVALQGTSRSTDVRSRLDGSPRPASHGIFSHAKVVVPAGHRIVVSNLQSTVTQDDIKELFEDIGQLLAAKLVRPGVAEVIYKNLKDAQKAVDTYHNRQLDGQPMKCLLVNKRPLNYPTALPIPKSESTSASRRLPAVPPCPPNNKLVPDINTIHKVLFHRN
ncbi:unnamed protein product [Phaedon cochleariae]|uniref:RRM domain-containing protein n=1 Tax=Phaedon cochleariae TaxID=80249 RepID=A0A9P0GTW6_PHACE|nr:unnamed protein product [Phaedon cochleariae]